MKRLLFLLPVAALSSAIPVRAAAISISSQGGLSTNNLGAFTGTISYDDVSTLTITLTNTTPSAGGYLTGFLFNINGDATATLTPNPTGGFEQAANESASPFGVFDAGAALGGDFLGGGSPNSGVAVGHSETFTFDIAGKNGFNPSALTVYDFVDKVSDGNGGYDATFVARFKGMSQGGSDKDSIPLPEPTLGAAALLGLWVASPKRRRRRVA